MGQAIVGVIANPMAGKDIRRLLSHASPTSDAAKIGIVRRAVIGAIEGGATEIVLAPDRHRLCERAVLELHLPVAVRVLDYEVEGRREETVLAARTMREQGASALIVLGGDGTHRDVAKGWLDAPMVTISTGTNNVFPRNIDATVAGLAAGVVSVGKIGLDEATERADVIHALLPNGETDLALVDVGVVVGSFTGSRAVWSADELLGVVSCITEPDTVGLASIGARLAPGSRRDAGGVHVVTSSPSKATRIVRAPIAPGSFADVGIESWSVLSNEEPVTVVGPCILSFDGERDIVLEAGASATLRIRRDGPRVIATSTVLRWAAQQELFVRPGPQGQRKARPVRVAKFSSSKAPVLGAPPKATSTRLTSTRSTR